MNKVIKLSAEILLNKAVFNQINKDAENLVQRVKRERLAQEARLEAMRSETKATLEKTDALIKAKKLSH